MNPIIKKVTVPWNSALLKNHMHGRNPHGGVYIKSATRQAQRHLIWVLKGAQLAFWHNKIWIKIMAFKPDHAAGDAVNLVDRICDCVKEVVRPDDRWFSLEGVDWRIDKVRPRIEITMTQEDRWDAQACSQCGGIKPFEQFHKNKSNKLGITSLCKPCRHETDRRKRDEQKQKASNPGN